MHVPTFPRAMHCLKVESCPPPPRGGGGGDGALVLNTLSSSVGRPATSAQPPPRLLAHPAVLSDAVRSFRHVIILVPALTSLQVLWSTCTHCFLLRTEGSQQQPTQLFPPSVVARVRSRLYGIPPSVFHRPFPPQDTCCRLLWTISKVHGFDKQNQDMKLFACSCGRSLAAGDSDRDSLPASSRVKQGSTPT